MAGYVATRHPVFFRTLGFPEFGEFPNPSAGAAHPTGYFGSDETEFLTPDRPSPIIKAARDHGGGGLAGSPRPQLANCLACSPPMTNNPVAHRVGIRALFSGHHTDGHRSTAGCPVARVDDVPFFFRDGEKLFPPAARSRAASRTKFRHTVGAVFVGCEIDHSNPVVAVRIRSILRIILRKVRTVTGANTLLLTRRVNQKNSYARRLSISPHPGRSVACRSREIGFASTAALTRRCGASESTWRYFSTELNASASPRRRFARWRS